MATRRTKPKLTGPALGFVVVLLLLNFIAAMFVVAYNIEFDGSSSDSEAQEEEDPGYLIWYYPPLWIGK